MKMKNDGGFFFFSPADPFVNILIGLSPSLENVLPSPRRNANKCSQMRISFTQILLIHWLSFVSYSFVWLYVSQRHRREETQRVNGVIQTHQKSGPMERGRCQSWTTREGERDNNADDLADLIPNEWNDRRPNELRGIWKTRCVRNVFCFLLLLDCIHA